MKKIKTEIEIDRWGHKIKRPLEPLPFKILCPFCSRPFNAQMLNTLYAADQGNSIDDQTYAVLEGKIQIRCNYCKKVVYKKEYYG